MKKVITIVVIIVIIIGGIFIWLNYKNKSDFQKVNLTSAQITSSNKIATEVLTSITDNNYNEYQKLSSPVMGTKENLKIIKNVFEEKFGSYKSLSYKEALTSKVGNSIIYLVDFSKKDNVPISISLNSKNKISGIRM